MNEDEDPYTHTRDTWTPLGKAAAELVSKLRSEAPPDAHGCALAQQTIQKNSRADLREEECKTKGVDVAFEQRSKRGFHRVSKYRKTAEPGA